MTAQAKDDDRKRQGVDATNREYLAYDQVEKRQEYRFSEKEGEEAFDDDFRVQTCDLGRALHGDAHDRQLFADELGEALSEIGFAILEGHGIDPDLHERAAEETERLFRSHSLEEKLRFRARRQGSVNQGYFPIEETSDIQPDLVEGWVFCRRAFLLDDGRSAPARWQDFWPDERSEAFFRELASRQEALILPIMRSLLRALGCEADLFDERLTRTNFALRLNHYPPIDEKAATDGAGRLLGHEDVDLFTLLPAPTREGLQVLNRADFRWIRLDAPPGSIILNTGDYMQRISNDRFPSTTHRVSRPSTEEARKQTRVSFPMNIYLWEHEMLEVLPGLGPPKYEPIDALTFHTRTTAKHYGDDHAAS